MRRSSLGLCLLLLSGVPNRRGYLFHWRQFRVQFFAGLVTDTACRSTLCSYSSHHDELSSPYPGCLTASPVRRGAS